MLWTFWTRPGRSNQISRIASCGRPWILSRNDCEGTNLARPALNSRTVIRNILRRANRNADLWPMALLLAAVLAPAACLLWFMNAVMNNERLAVRQKLTEIYDSQLSSSQRRLAKSLDHLSAELD